MPLLYNLTNFMEDAIRVHGGTYTYNNIGFESLLTPITITCAVHGDFELTPHAHIHKGTGCAKCTNQALDTEGFISKAVALHGAKYGYSQVHYIDMHTPVKIICAHHGVFEQRPVNHIYGNNGKGSGCAKCFTKLLTTATFIKRAKIVHNNIYSYNRTVYVNYKSKVIVTCAVHGDFSITATRHLAQAKGCMQCAKEKRNALINNKRRVAITNKLNNLTTTQFIELAVRKHGNAYNYHLCVFIHKDLPITITCELHGNFSITPHMHLKGSKFKCMCPECSWLQRKPTAKVKLLQEFAGKTPFGTFKG